MRKIRLLLLASCFSITVFSQEAGRNTVSIGVGGGFPVTGRRTEGIANGAAFSASYEFRLFKYLAPEVDVVNLIPNVEYGSKFGIVTSRERVTLLSFGVRGIAPLSPGRIELFA